MNVSAIRTGAALTSTAHCRRVRQIVVAVLGLVTMLQGGSCAMPQRTYQPAQDPATLDDVSFLHYLATVPVVTVDEGMRAVLLLAGDGARWSTFDQRYEELRGRGAVKEAWRLEPGRILDKGALAHMLQVICDLPRSLDDVLASKTGVGDRRYALKTCIHEGVMPYGVAHERVTGGELLSALTNAEGYLASP
ncbi:MAG: hypothetical protein JSU86_09855 [Phycisphaerales bacterium]|nr:MAG: hypothetical protein JSU86_09855 [Phycisphaerales bacterium]